MTNAPGVPAPLPRPSAIGRLPIIEASGAAAAMTIKTIREVESAPRFWEDLSNGSEVMMAIVSKVTAQLLARPIVLRKGLCRKFSAGDCLVYDRPTVSAG